MLFWYEIPNAKTESWLPLATFYAYMHRRGRRETLIDLSVNMQKAAKSQQCFKCTKHTVSWGLWVAQERLLQKLQLLTQLNLHEFSFCFAFFWGRAVGRIWQRLAPYCLLKTRQCHLHEYDTTALFKCVQACWCHISPLPTPFFPLHGQVHIFICPWSKVFLKGAA